MLCVMAWRCGGVAAYMRSASFVVDVPRSSGSFSWIFVICPRQSAKSRLSMGLSVLGIGGWVASCACRQTKHCVPPHVLQRWQPVVLILQKQQVRCSAILSNSAEHSLQMWRSSAAASMLSACFASALMLRHWRDASEMLLCCGPGLLRRIREVSMSPLLRPLYLVTPSRRSRSNLWHRAISTLATHSFQASATFCTGASKWCAHVNCKGCFWQPIGGWLGKALGFVLCLYVVSFGALVKLRKKEWCGVMGPAAQSVLE